MQESVLFLRPNQPCLCHSLQADTYSLCWYGNENTVLSNKLTVHKHITYSGASRHTRLATDECNRLTIIGCTRLVTNGCAILVANRPIP